MTDGSPPPRISGDAPRDVRRPHVEASLITALTRLIEGGAAPNDISISRLAREAGIGRATFYLYFADRRAFNLRLLAYGREVLAPSLEQLWAAIVSGRWDASEDALRGFFATYREYGPLALAVADAAATDPEVATQINEQMAALIELTAAAIEAGKQAGAIHDGVLPGETAAILVWMAERACFQIARTADDEHIDRLTQAVAFLGRHGVFRT